MHQLIVRCSNNIQDQLICEYHNLVLWVPVLFGLGITLYAFPLSLSYIYIIAALCVVGLYCTKHIAIIILLRTVLVVVLGMGCMKLHISSSPVHTIDREYKFVTVQGYIQNIIPQVSGDRLVISGASICMNSNKCLRYNGVHNIIGSAHLKDSDYKVRINIRGNNKLNDIQIGNYISLKAILKPPSIPITPDGYDFAFHSYFNHIAATGYAVSGIQKIAADSHDLPLLDRLLLLFAQLRYKISQQVIDLLGEGRGHIASALMIGEYHSMDKQLLQNIRGSGLAHLLAVSGMHISIVASVFFFGSRILMAAYMPLVIRYNIKKIAAIIALVGSMGYLFISGMQVSAIRAFIMNFFIILAIILDRSPYPMRSIAFAALVIMIWMPHSIFTPGFQMSFAAVASLIFFM